MRICNANGIARANHRTDVVWIVDVFEDHRE